MLSQLPRECILYIAINFTPQELTDFSILCKAISKLVRDDFIWEHYCFRDKGFNFKLNTMSWFQMYFYPQSANICPHLSLLGIENLSFIANCFKKLHPVLQICQAQDCNYGFNRLWFCATPGCRYIGCGRRDNAHALNHFKELGHPLIIKLNTVEMWCYQCTKWCGNQSSDPIESQKVLSVISYIGLNCDKSFLSSTFLRRQKERDLGPEERLNTTWAIIELNWYKSWERFIIGDLEEFSAPIDNQPLLSDGRFNFLLRGTWTHVSLATWEYLQRTYGGGPLILL